MCFTHDDQPRIGFEQPTETVAKDRLLIGDDDPNGLRCIGRGRHECRRGHLILPGHCDDSSKTDTDEPGHDSPVCLAEGEPMIRITIAAVGLALVLPASVGAQNKTDFSGTWNVDTAKSDPAPQGGGRSMGGGPTTKLVITQSATELIAVTTNARGETRTVYKLDGSDMNETTQMGTSKSNVSWDGGKLVVSRVQSITTPQGSGEITSKEVYTLEGNVLTLVTSRTMPMGTTTRKTVFNKS